MPTPPADLPTLDATWSALLGLRDLPGERAETDLHACGGADRVLLGYAPTALLAGCWLVPATHVRHADRELGAACLDAHFNICGDGDAAHHRGNRYRALLASRGLAPPDLTLPRALADPRLTDDDLTLALPGLHLSHQRGDIAADMLGFHAAWALLGLPPAVRLAAADSFHTLESNTAKAVALARRILQAHATLPAPNWSHVWRGAWRLVHARQTWRAALHPADPPSARAAMLALIARKARHARGHHPRIKLQGRPLDEWFAGPPEALLDALAQSHWITPGRPDDSRLAAHSIQFGGPMFGIFDDDDIAVVRAWIAALPASSQSLPPPHVEPPPPFRPHSEPPHSPRSIPSDLKTPHFRPHSGPPRSLHSIPSNHKTLSAPRLYDRLVRQDPDAPDLARAHLARVLDGPAHGPFARAPHDLPAWVDAEIRTQVHAPDAPPPRDLTRADVVWLLTQLAPAALVDGAWLQGLTAPLLCHTASAALLLRIYRDELGAGVPRQHHGNVMRATLAAEGVELPPCDSPAFHRLPAFVPEAFAMPALWLAIAASPAHLPELLGLNLAIEMAGIGAGYRRAIALLRHHSISPYFFELHNSIDNAATGHTEWSTRAIALHLDPLHARGDHLALQREWRRIHRGFAAYAATSRPLVRALALRLGPRVGLRWLRRQFTTLTRIGN